MSTEDMKKADMAHQSHEGRTETGEFLSSYRLVYTVGSVVQLKKTHMVINTNTRQAHSRYKCAHIHT